MLFECLPHARLALSLSSCLPASSWNDIRGSGPARRDYAARRLPSSTRCRGEPRLDRLGTRGPIRLGRTMRRLCHFPLPPGRPPLGEPHAAQSRAATSPADQLYELRTANARAGNVPSTRGSLFRRFAHQFFLFLVLVRGTL